MSDDEILAAADDFDFVGHYGDPVQDQGDELLPDNVAGSAISCGFIGIGGDIPAGTPYARASLPPAPRHRRAFSQNSDDPKWPRSLIKWQ